DHGGRQLLGRIVQCLLARGQQGRGPQVALRGGGEGEPERLRRGQRDRLPVRHHRLLLRVARGPGVPHHARDRVAVGVRDVHAGVGEPPAGGGRRQAHGGSGLKGGPGGGGGAGRGRDQRERLLTPQVGGPVWPGGGGALLGCLRSNVV